MIKKIVKSDPDFWFKAGYTVLYCVTVYCVARFLLCPLIFK